MGQQAPGPTGKAGNAWDRGGGLHPQRPPAPGRWAHVAGIDLHWEGVRDARVVLLHGYLASTAVWRGVMAELSNAGLTSLAIDLPGFGYSSRPPDAPYTLSWYADIVDEVIRSLCRPPVLLVGHSLGGAVAIEHVAGGAASVAGLVLAAPFVYRSPAPPGLRLAARWPGFYRRLFSSVPGRMVIGHLLQKASCDADGFDGDPVRLLLGHLDAEEGWMCAQKVGTHVLRSAPDEDVLRRADVPLLVLWGERDAVISPDVGHRLCGDWAGPCGMASLSAGHNVHMDDPVGFAEHVLHWTAHLSA